MKTTIAAAVIAFGMIGGPAVDAALAATSSAPAGAATSAPATPVTSAAANLPTTGNSAVMATVNGKPIFMNELNEILVYSYGLPVAQQLIANELVRQECERLNVTVTDKDIQNEHAKALAQMWKEPGMTAADREKAFQRFLVSSKVTRKQWDFTMRRNAQLSKLAEPRIKITDADIEEAFNEVYGRKVVVRHIEFVSLTEAQEVLAKLEKGEDFLAMVKKYSRNTATVANGGLLMPISRATPGFPPAMKDAALAMKNIGQLSPVIQTGDVFHILKCDQIIKPQNARIEDVREKLRAAVRERQLQLQQQAILMDLIDQARKKGSINFTNPTLREVWQEAANEGQPAGK